MFISDFMSFVLNEPMNRVEIHHFIKDTEFEENFVITGDENKPIHPGGFIIHDPYDKFVEQFISIYKSRNMEVARNLALFIQNEMLAYKEVIVDKVKNNHPQYLEELEKYLLLV